MKKMFKSYFAIWAILLILFNVIAFVSVGWVNQAKYTPSSLIFRSFAKENTLSTAVVSKCFPQIL